MKSRTPQSTGPELRIDLAAIAANFRLLETLVGSNTEIASVVKSDAYGLGLHPIVAALAEVGCRSLFVANLQEALLARRISAKIEHIYVLAGVKDAELEICLSHRLAPVCNSLADAIAAARQIPEFVLNVDTGFSRFGLSFSELRTFLHRSGRAPDLLVSHLACSDIKKDETNPLQRDRFVAMSQLVTPLRRSLAASAAVWLGERFHFDMVRAGSALFGLNNAHLDPNPLYPAIQLFARIADVRIVQRGEAVGYAASFRAPYTMRVGIVSLGYAAGLPWSAGNRISVLLGSHRVSVVGRVAMEYVAIDLSDVPPGLCFEGQQVEFVGPDFSVDDMAEASLTIPQELLLRLGLNCPRSYTASRGSEP